MLGTTPAASRQAAAEAGSGDSVTADRRNMQSAADGWLQYKGGQPKQGYFQQHPPIEEVQEVWTQQLQLSGQQGGVTPVVNLSPPTVYAGGAGGFFAFDARTGEQRWQAR